MIKINKVFSIIILVSILFSFFNGHGAEVSVALMESGTSAIELGIKLAGTIAIWSGLMEIARTSGILKHFSILLEPIITYLFPDVNKNAKQAICINMVANLFGLGNAATPAGLEAVKEMAKTSEKPGVATNSMARFVVMNTASLQLIPSTTAAIRAAAGANSPFDILIAVWLASIISLAGGLIAAFILEKRSK